MSEWDGASTSTDDTEYDRPVWDNPGHCDTEPAYGSASRQALRVAPSGRYDMPFRPYVYGVSRYGFRKPATVERG